MTVVAAFAAATTTALAALCQTSVAHEVAATVRIADARVPIEIGAPVGVQVSINVLILVVVLVDFQIRIGVRIGVDMRAMCERLIAAKLALIAVELPLRALQRTLECALRPLQIV